MLGNFSDSDWADVSLEAIKTFTEAIQTIDPQKAFGKASKVWVKFAQFYEELYASRATRDTKSLFIEHGASEGINEFSSSELRAALKKMAKNKAG